MKTESRRVKRDLTADQLAYRLRKAGWTPEGFMGYWKGPRSGVCVSTWNYPRRRDALRAMAAIDAKHALAKIEKGAPQ